MPGFKVVDGKDTVETVSMKDMPWRALGVIVDGPYAGNRVLKASDSVILDLDDGDHFDEWFDCQVRLLPVGSIVTLRVTE